MTNLRVKTSPCLKKYQRIFFCKYWCPFTAGGRHPEYQQLFHFLSSQNEELWRSTWSSRSLKQQNSRRWHRGICTSKWRSRWSEQDCAYLFPWDLALGYGNHQVSVNNFSQWCPIMHCRHLCYNVICSSDGNTRVPTTVPDTITEWIGNAVCLSKTDGLGVSRPASLIAFQPFFVSMNLPYSVKRQERLPVSVTVSNYQSRCMAVSVYTLFSFSSSTLSWIPSFNCLLASYTLSTTLYYLLTLYPLWLSSLTPPSLC